MTRRISERPNTPKGLLANERGIAMVEFAIILPVLMLILFGILEFAFIMYDKAVVTNLSREGARLASLYYTNPSDPTDHVRPVSDIQTWVVTNPRNTLFTFGADTLTASDIVVNRTFDNGQYFQRVTVNYSYDFMVLPSFLAGLMGPIDLSAVAVMRDENQSP